MSLRTIKLLTVDTRNNVLIQFKGRNVAITSKALDVKRNQSGDISYLLLDKNIHSEGESQINVLLKGKVQTSFKVSGAYVTELTLENSSK